MAPVFRPPLALYIHIPLCASKCAYCDFFSLPRACGDLDEGQLVEAILARVQAATSLYRPLGSPPFQTIYIGGGTPTALDLGAFRRLLAGLADLAGPVREWTLEANPESLDEARLDAALEAGVNRVSIGIQSLDDGLLSRLGRPADSRTALEALARAASRQGLRVSADLIAGLPRSSPLEDEVSRLLDYGLDHLSIYDLTLEEATPLYAQVRAGAFLLPGPDEALDEVQRAAAVLSSMGLRRYEVSNWAKPGAESLHNLAYWHMDSYLGLGPGGVSTLQVADGAQIPAGLRGASLRLEETRDIAAFMDDPEGEEASRQEISPRDSAFEAILMGYRTIFGLDEGAFASRFGLGAPKLVAKTLKAWARHMVKAAPRPAWEGRLALDDSGLDLLNGFLVDCLGELEESFPKPL
jgi:oxygen-independent coproporphyrinogen-3 oxidase